MKCEHPKSRRLAFHDGKREESVQWCKDCGSLGVLDEIALAVHWIGPNLTRLFTSEMLGKSRTWRIMAGSARSDEEADILRHCAEELEKMISEQG